MPEIECRGLVRRFAAATALDGVSLTLGSGAWTTLVGPSGSGKTTLLRVIAGLERLDAGEVWIDNQAATNRVIALPPHRRGIGFLFQGESLWPHLTALENVMLGMRGPARERRARAREWLERLEIAAGARRLPGELSGGEARRVALARALACGPRILLLDEPAAHLDLHLREGLMALLRRLHGELGLTTLCATHQLEPPIDPGARLVVLEGGRILHDGPASSLDAVSQTPFVAALMRHLRVY